MHDVVPQQDKTTPDVRSIRGARRAGRHTRPARVLRRLWKLPGTEFLLKGRVLGGIYPDIFVGAPRSGSMMRLFAKLRSSPDPVSFACRRPEKTMQNHVPTPCYLPARLQPHCKRASQAKLHFVAVNVQSSPEPNSV